MTCLLKRFSFNHKNKSKSKEVSELQQKIIDLENKIDKNTDGVITMSEVEQYIENKINSIDSNKDGIVTKEELEKYVENEMKPYLNKIEKLNKKNQELRKQLDKYKKESEDWKASYDILYHNFKEQDEIKLDLSKPKVSHVSEKCIENYVQEHIIQNPKMNFRWIPDGPESRIWTFMLYQTLKSIDVTLSNIGIRLPGHRLTLSIRPDSKEEDK